MATQPQIPEVNPASSGQIRNLNNLFADAAECVQLDRAVVQWITTGRRRKEFHREVMMLMKRVGRPFEMEGTSFMLDVDWETPLPQLLAKRAAEDQFGGWKVNGEIFPRFEGLESRREHPDYRYQFLTLGANVPYSYVHPFLGPNGYEPAGVRPIVELSRSRGLLNKPMNVVGTGEMFSTGMTEDYSCFPGLCYFANSDFPEANCFNHYRWIDVCNNKYLILVRLRAD